MTDAGGFKPADPCPQLSEQERLIGKIAEALNVPVSVFRSGSAPVSSDGGPTATDCVAVVAAFSRIGDPDLRRQCLAMIERCADG